MEEKDWNKFATFVYQLLCMRVMLEKFEVNL